MSCTGISNIDMEKFFNNEENVDLKKNYIGVYSSNNLTRYINFCDVIKERNAKYPFAISNTDRNNKAGPHWWVFYIFNQKKKKKKKKCLYLIV